MSKTLIELNDVEPIESKYDLETIRRRLSGLLKDEYFDMAKDRAILELIHCLANEIAEIKNKNKDLK